MSEQKTEYVADALEMIGVVKPKKIIQEISGFVPVFDVLVEAYHDHITALVFGRRWQYCRMEDGVCRASLSRIAKDLHLDEATILRHTEKLVNDGYLVDLTPDRRNRPHVYADAGRVVMKSFLGVAQSNTSIAQSNVGIAQSQLIKQDYTSNKETDFPLTKKELEQVNTKVDAIIGLSGDGASWQGRELIREDLLPLADWYNQATNQVMTKRVQKSWWKALGEWKEEGLQPEHLQIAFDSQSKWRLVSDPNMLTKDAVAVKAAGITKLVEPGIEMTRLL